MTPSLLHSLPPPTPDSEAGTPSLNSGDLEISEYAMAQTHLLAEEEVRINNERSTATCHRNLTLTTHAYSFYLSYLF